MVLIRYLSVDSPYISGHVIDHGYDTPVESFIVHSPNIGMHVGCGYEGRQALFLKSGATCVDMTLILAMITRYNCTNQCML